MDHSPSPATISVCIAAYQAEEWIAEALDSILAQTRPPDEVVVVDDGSTDGTPEVLASYGERIRVFRQENAGYPTAMNRAIRESVGDYVAPTGADDLWEPRKLEWQAEAIAAHPEIGVHFGHAVFFGRVEGDYERPTGSGPLDNRTLLHDLFRVYPINMPSTVIRRDLFESVAWFRDGFLADDSEFFFNCLRAGVRFYYEPRTLVRYRAHDVNITNNVAAVREGLHTVRSWNLDLLDDPRFAARAMADDFFRIGRAHIDEGRPREGRRAIRHSLRYARGNSLYGNVRALAWVGILSLPRGVSRSLVEAAGGLQGALGEIFERPRSA
ncbi:MAG TPA: glycosyltransferase [Solirubrobacterales bacterium]|jgi:glycosyltransferase involved in cell wall biosynthesis|nr:glycosyltransferase [Solirubrobacterales bacterium]